LVSIFFSFRAFDVDMLYLAQRFKIPIGEVAISWQEIEGTYTCYICFHSLKVKDTSLLKPNIDESLFR